MVYKAVFVKDGKYLSLMHKWPAGPKYAVRYQPYKWAYPKLPDSKLFVWKNLTDALRFVRKYSPNTMALFRCRTKDLKKTHWISVIPSSGIAIEMFWRGTPYPGYLRLPPYGTYGASAVMLTERVGM